jgi:LmbE family N-acetylglucosaminyl deacetylase
MEPIWNRFDFAIDVTDVYENKKQAMAAYEAVFSGQQAQMLQRVEYADRYYGGLVGVDYAEIFRCRSPVVIEDLSVFGSARFG